MFGSPLVVPENLPVGSEVEMVQFSSEPIDAGGQLISVNVRRLQTDAVLERSRSVVLSGRWPHQGSRTTRKPPTSWFRIAIGMALGVAALFFASGAKDAVRVIAILGSLILLVVSIGVASERVFAHLADRSSGLRPSVRTALRDLARSRGRTGPLTIALVAALTLSVMMLTILSSTAAHSRATYQPALEESQVLIAAQSQAADDAVAKVIGAPAALPLRAALVPEAALAGLRRSSSSVQSSAAGIPAELYGPQRTKNGVTTYELGGTVGIVRPEDMGSFTSAEDAARDLAVGKAVVLSPGLLRNNGLVVQPGEIDIAGVEHIGTARPRLASVANNETPLRPPYGLLAAMLFGLVVVAGLSGALFTRNAPSVVRQRAV